MPDTITNEKSKRQYKRHKPFADRKKPTKTSGKHLAHLLGDHKLTPSEAARVLGVTPNSVYDALQRYKIDISALDLDRIKNEHESELIAINALARGRIFDKLLNDPKLGLIEMTAVLDRSFQQLRELQGKGHNSINIFTTIIQQVDDNIVNVQVKTQDIVSNKPAIQDVVQNNAT